MYIPTDEDCPVDLHWLDLYRVTKTSLPSEIEKEVKDIWDPNKPQTHLSAPWVGETIFELFTQGPNPDTDGKVAGRQTTEDV